jgi:BirA family transcriptional regulator, biotin operon repressor / biotin---[acetyl-CoA-carboxylase] ligase
MENEVRRFLRARGREWPAPIAWVESVGSTNDLLKQRAREGAPAWSAVVAESQTAGRGRQGRAWLSPPGNLFLSLLLRPVLPPQSAGVLPLAAGVAAAEATAEWGVESQLKWPNDVVVGERKIGGVLVEASSAGSEGLEAVVVGVGLNLVLDPAAAPPALRDAVTSVQAVTGADPGVAAAAAAVLDRLAVWYHALAREGAPVALAAWRARSVPWWGRAVEARSGDAVLRGVARGVDGRGALILDLADGSQRAVLSGEVRELRLES